MTAGMEPTVEIEWSKSERVLPMNAPSALAAHHILAPFLRYSVIPRNRSHPSVVGVPAENVMFIQSGHFKPCAPS
jgi:hypothetical protein